MHFEVLKRISKAEVIAVGRNIRDFERLKVEYGRGRWRKLKCIAQVRLQNGKIRKVELHWYEAHGIGKTDEKIKRYLDD